MILYVIQFHNGLIKVGKTTKRYEDRRNAHLERNPHLRVVKEFWCETKLSELKLIGFCEDNGDLCKAYYDNGHTREWFYNLDFDTVVAYLKSTVSATRIKRTVSSRQLKKIFRKRKQQQKQEKLKELLRQAALEEIKIYEYWSKFWSEN